MLVLVNENLSTKFGKHYGSRETAYILSLKKEIVQFPSNSPRLFQFSTFLSYPLKKNFKPSVSSHETPIIVFLIIEYCVFSGKFGSYRDMKYKIKFIFNSKP